MLRFMAPYLVFAAVVAVAAAAAHGAGSITVPMLYAFMFAAILVARLGYARWTNDGTRRDADRLASTVLRSL
jgi:hypothetical protein